MGHQNQSCNTFDHRESDHLGHVKAPKLYEMSPNKTCETQSRIFTMHKSTAYEME